MPLELFSNNPVTTVTAGGTDAPAAGTVETWTVSSSAAFPAADDALSPPQQFHVSDPLLADEIIAVTKVSGTAWTVTRGAENTIPAAHASGFAVEQVVSAGAYASFIQDSTPLGGDLSGTLPNPVIASVGGVTTSGTVQAGSVLYGTSATSAKWTTNPPGFLYNGTAVGGDLSGTLPNPSVAGVNGLPVASSPGGTADFLRADGTWAAPPSAAAPPVDWLNVKNAPYSAKGDGSTDDTTAIQAALTAAASTGGTVYFPAGTYQLSAALTVTGYTTLIGAGDEATVLKQTSTTANGLSGTDVTQFSLRGLKISGPGSGSGKGIALGLSSHTNTGFLHFADVWVELFGSDGISLATPIVSVFDRVNCQANGGNGWTTSSGTSSTSCTWNSCYANGNAGYGYSLTAQCYSTLNACAADSNANAYYLSGCQSVTLNGCGAESTTTDSFIISGGYGNTLLSPRTYLNGHYGIHVTNSAKDVAIIGAVDNTPASGAANFILTDSGTVSSLIACSNTSANLFNGSTTVLNDGGGDITAPGTLFLNGGSTIKFGAASDADLYRLAANSLATDGALTAYGNTTVSGTLYLNGGATIKFGSANDTDLYRTATNSLATDGLFTAWGGFASGGNIDISTAGSGLRVKEGTNAKQGTATLAAGTVTVANTSVTSTSRIFLTIQSAGGTVGSPYVSARTAGTSFTIKSTSTSDTSVVAYEIVEPG